MLKITACMRRRVAVLGSDTPVVTALATFMKAHPIITSLHVPTDAMVRDLAQIPSHCAVSASNPADTAGDREVLMVCPSDVADLETTLKNAAASESGSSVHGQRFVFIVSRDTNFMTVRACDVWKNAIGLRQYDPKRVMGVATLPVFRARTHLASTVKRNPFDIDVTIAGGATADTAVPLFAATAHHFGLSNETIEAITISARQEPPVSSQGRAYAASEFIFSFLKALRGDSAVSECVFMQQWEDVKEEGPCPAKCPQYFCRRVGFGKSGAERLVPLGGLSPYEISLVEVACAHVEKDIERAKGM